MGPTQLERSRRYRQTPRGKYSLHKRNALHRGVGFELTFDQWWAIWSLSGKWGQRGNRKGLFCMMRYADRGPYAVGNVSIGSWSANTAERNQTSPVRRHTARTTAVTWQPDDISDTVEDAEAAPF